MPSATNPSRRKRTFIFWPALVLVAVLVSAMAAEVMIRLVVPEEFFWPVSNIYAAHRNERVGYTLRPGFRGVAFGVALETNHLGFRGPDWSNPKPLRRFRIAIVGDSHAFAYGVAFEKSVGEVLAALLNERGDGDYEVLNFGVPGFNIENSLGVVREYVLAHDPDVLIVMPSGNDHQPGHRVDADGWLLSGENPSDEARVGDRATDRVTVQGRRLWTGSRLALYWKLTSLRRAFERDTNRTDRLPLERLPEPREWMGPIAGMPMSDSLAVHVDAPLRRTIALAREAGVHVCLATVSAAPEYRSLCHEIERSEEVPTVELIALLPDVRSLQMLRAKYSLGWDSHFNANAHELWARGLVRLLDRAGYLPEQRSRPRAGG